MFKVTDASGKKVPVQRTINSNNEEVVKLFSLHNNLPTFASRSNNTNLLFDPRNLSAEDLIKSLKNSKFYSTQGVAGYLPNAERLITNYINVHNIQDKDTSLIQRIIQHEDAPLTEYNFAHKVNYKFSIQEPYLPLPTKFTMNAFNNQVQLEMHPLVKEILEVGNRSGTDKNDILRRIVATSLLANSMANTKIEFDATDPTKPTISLNPILIGLRDSLKLNALDILEILKNSGADGLQELLNKQFLKTKFIKGNRLAPAPVNPAKVYPGIYGTKVDGKNFASDAELQEYGLQNLMKVRMMFGIPTDTDTSSKYKDCPEILKLANFIPYKVGDNTPLNILTLLLQFGAIKGPRDSQLLISKFTDWSIDPNNPAGTADTRLLGNYYDFLLNAPGSQIGSYIKILQFKKFNPAYFMARPRLKNVQVLKLPDKPADWLNLLGDASAVYNSPKRQKINSKSSSSCT